MALMKRLRRWWSLFGTEEVFHDDGTTTRRSVVLRSSRL